MYKCRLQRYEQARKDTSWNFGRQSNTQMEYILNVCISAWIYTLLSKKKELNALSWKEKIQLEVIRATQYE